MKKSLLFLAAILTVTLAAVSFTSCSDDDDDSDKVQTFTLLMQVESSSLTAAELAEINIYIQNKMPPATVRTTKSEAISKFDDAISQNGAQFQIICDNAAASTGVYDLTFVLLLLDEDAKVVKQQKYTPRKK